MCQHMRINWDHDIYGRVGSEGPPAKPAEETPTLCSLWSKFRGIIMDHNDFQL